MTEHHYIEILKAISETLEAKNETIKYQNYKISNLEARLKDCEKHG